jgi:hypothetical protein
VAKARAGTTTSRARAAQRPPSKSRAIITRASTRATAATAAQVADAWRRDAELRQSWLSSASASGERDLTAVERMRAVRSSRMQYKRSGVYGQIVDCLVNFTIGDGVRREYESKAVAEWMNDLLMRPENSWERTLRPRTVALLIDGERLCSYTVTQRGPDASGAPVLGANVLLGRMEPDDIKSVHVMRHNVDRVLALTMKGEEPGEQDVTYPAALVAPDGSVALRDNGDGTSTALMLHRVNVLGRRGLPFLTRSIDKATSLDTAVEELSRKIEYTSRFWLHGKYEPTGVKAQDKKIERELRAWLESWMPGEVCVTTANVTVEAVAPELQVPAAREFVEMLLEYILGAHGIPRMWYSAGGDTNRATAVEQGTPIHRSIDALQGVVKADLEEEHRFLIAVGKKVGAIPAGESDEFTLTMADVATRDSLRDVNELAGLIVALDAAVASFIVSPEERQAIGRAAIKGKQYGRQLSEKPPAIPAEAGQPQPPEDGGPVNRRQDEERGDEKAPEQGQERRDERT